MIIFFLFRLFPLSRLYQNLHFACVFSQILDNDRDFIVTWFQDHGKYYFI
jgi:hypothetical protein